MQVLVIEDDPAMAELVCATIESLGHETTVAIDGAAGLEAAAKSRPDLVICDVLTPRVHGYEVIQRLRSSPATQRVPIIVISAKGYATDQRSAFNLGADAFLKKPFEPTELADLVEQTLGAVRVRFWGVRGSIATPGPETLRYGGNTPCVTVEFGRETLILDAGTGLRRLGMNLMAEAGGKAIHLSMLITHTHWDHIQGFPFFVPAYLPSVTLDVYGPRSIDKPLEKVLRGQMDPEYFPVALGDMAAKMNVHEIREQDLDIGVFKVRAMYINHPGVTMAYRIEVGGKVVTYATDVELFRSLNRDRTDVSAEIREYGDKRDAELIELARDADLYIADAQYTPEEYHTKRGWGHTCYVDAMEIGLQSNARMIALFSHDPMHDDDLVDAKLEHCRRIAAEAASELEVIAAVERGVVNLRRG